MSRTLVALLLASATCFGWGTLAPLIGKLMGNGAHPMTPFVWNAIGTNVFLAVVLLATNFAPLKTLSWSGQGLAIAFFWPVASLAFTVALYFAPEKSSVLNAIAASYPAVVSLPLIWYFLGEPMNLQKVSGLALAVIGVVIAILA